MTTEDDAAPAVRALVTADVRDTLHADATPANDEATTT